jgi:hypothetical protein
MYLDPLWFMWFYFLNHNWKEYVILTWQSVENVTSLPIYTFVGYCCTVMYVFFSLEPIYMYICVHSTCKRKTPINEYFKRWFPSNVLAYIYIYMYLQLCRYISMIKGCDSTITSYVYIHGTYVYTYINSYIYIYAYLQLPED